VIGDAGAADPGQRRFAGGVHVEHEDLVGTGQRGRELVGEGLVLE